MDFTDFDEPVKAGAVFSGGKVTPKWFSRGGRKHEIKNIEFTWNERSGTQEIINFSVTADAFSAEISFNKKLLVWRLKKIINT